MGTATDSISDRVLVKTRVGSIRGTTILLSIMLLVFAGTSAFFALRLNREIVPDEPLHFTLSKHFATRLTIPPDTPDTFQYGAIGHKPYLYYWINGRALNVLALIDPSYSDWRALALLRLISVGYATLTLVFAYLLAGEILPNRWWRLLVVFMLTSTLMFVFMAGGVNYDSLTTLCSFAAVYFLVRILKGKSLLTNSIVWLSCLLLGTLVKITVLPLAAATFIPWVLFVYRNRRRLPLLIAWQRQAIGLAAVLAVLIGLNFAVYGVNLIRYQRLIPACTQLLTQDQCRQNPLVVREAALGQGEKITAGDVLAGRYPDPIGWFFDFWFPNMQAGIYGIVAHRIYLPPLVLSFHLVFAVWLLLLVVRHLRTVTPPVVGLLAVVLCYGLILMATNYNSELQSGFKHWGIQGRYIFPVLGVLFVLVAHFLSQVPDGVLRRATVAFALILFAWGSPVKTLLTSFTYFLPQPLILAEQPLGDLATGNGVGQQFTSECRGTMDRIDVRLGRAAQSVDGGLKARLVYADTGQVISETVIVGETIVDRAWQTVEIPPVTNAWGTTFQFQLTSPDSAVVVWSSASDRYGWGQALVNGQLANTDLSFRYRCTQPVLADWFN